MEVKIIRSVSIQAVNANGPFTRTFNVGDIVDVPSITARFWLAQNNAVLAGKKAAPAPKTVETVEAAVEAPEAVEAVEAKPAKATKKTR